MYRPTLLLFLIVLTTSVLQGQSELNHLKLVAKDLCAGIEQLPEVDTSLWWIETLDEEIKSLTVGAAAAQAYQEEEDITIGTALNNSERRHRQIYAEVFVACPESAASRLLQQQIAEGGGYGLTERPAWEQLVRYLREEVVPEALVSEQKMLYTYFTQAIDKSTAAQLRDSLAAGNETADFTDLLITAVSADVPEVMARHQLENYDSEAITKWLMGHRLDSLSQVLYLEDEYQRVCERFADVSSLPDVDMTQIDALVASDVFSNPPAPSVEKFGTIYGAPIINRATMATGPAGIIFMRLLQECDAFRGLLRNHGFEHAMELVEATEEERKEFGELMDKICGCMQLGTQSEAMECFEQEVNAFGLGDDVRSMSAMADNPELQRRMTVFQTLMPVIGSSCAPKFNK